MEASAAFFETRIRPQLFANCFKCHGPDKQESSLRLDSREAMLKGGDTGPAIVPGKPDESLLIDAVRHGKLYQMPPKRKLAPAVIADLSLWIASGAPWPDAKPAAQPQAAPGKSSPLFTEEQRRFWAFVPPVEPSLPAVMDAGWCRTPVDRFIRAGLESKGLRAAAPTSKRILIRRATFDLTGVPPAPDEVERFVGDASPDAYARLIERLLASPRYGERWGRHWLDVARFADSNGMDENLAYVNAYRYRDYVIAAFNSDKPYDEFVHDQIAGDLPSDPGTQTRKADSSRDSDRRHERLIATGFLCLGPKMLAEDDPVKMEMDIVDEQIDTVGRAFMGMTLGCARCHTHKFDPIPIEDYYSLAGIFRSTKTMENFKVVAVWQERPLAESGEVARREVYERQASDLRAAITKLEKSIKESTRTGGGNASAAAAAASTKPGAKLHPAEELKRLKESLASLERQAPPELPRAMAVSEGKVGNVRVHYRGNHLTLGEEVPRRFPRIMAGESQPAVGAGSGRLKMAQWLTGPSHPLTARVMANRIWHWHFGAGIVRSTDNFGKLGDRPSNQALLDWLAVRFVQSGWSIKQLHRTIMLSSTYQMTTANDEYAVSVDPENRLHWRQNRRRLEAEAIRDSILAVSGSLEHAMGGTMLAKPGRAYVTSTASVDDTNYDCNRRSVYLPVVRSALFDVFQAFDFADPSMPAGERPATTVAPQALFMMNSPLMLKESALMARRLLDLPNLDDSGRARVAYGRCFSRAPSPAETARLLNHVRQIESSPALRSIAPAERRTAAWQSACRVLLSTNEFIYLE